MAGRLRDVSVWKEVFPYKTVHSRANFAGCAALRVGQDPGPGSQDPDLRAGGRSRAGLAGGSMKLEGSRLKGRSLRRIGRSSIPPGAAKTARAGIAFATSMSCSRTLPFSSEVREVPALALARSW